MRVMLKSVLAAALAATIAVPALAQVEKKNVTIATASLGLPYLPLVLANKLGYFKEEGVTVEIAAFSGGSKALEALIGGSADVVSGAYSHTINLATKGEKLKSFLVQVRYPGLAIGVGKQKAAQVKSVKDLKGMKIGVSAPGSSTHMIVNYALTKEGIKPDEVSIIGVGTSAAAVQALKSGQIDAIINSDPVMAMLEEGGDAVILHDLRTEAGTTKLFGSAYPEAGFYAKADFIAKNPNTIQALTNAAVRAEQWIAKATPDQVADAVPPELLLNDRALYIKAFTKMRQSISPDGTMTEAGAKTVRDVLMAFSEDIRAAAPKVDLSQTYDNRFVEKALAKYK
jgi:NitT/TauT family transport system substrate-binding protein